MAETAELLQERRAALQAAEEAAKAEKTATSKPSSKPVPWTAKSGDALNPATPGGAGSVAGLVMIAGGVTFLGEMRHARSFPVQGTRIVVSTLLLAIILSFFDRGRLSQPLRWVGYLMILAALIRQVPRFQTKKGK